MMQGLLEDQTIEQYSTRNRLFDMSRDINLNAGGGSSIKEIEARGAAKGRAIGGTIGSTIGYIFGPIGSLIGGAAGTGLGHLFGREGANARYGDQLVNRESKQQNFISSAEAIDFRMKQDSAAGMMQRNMDSLLFSNL